MKKPDTLENQVNYAYLGIGSNLGKKITNIEKAKHLLISNQIKIKSSSGFYSSKSWPNPKFPDFLNIVILVKTHLNKIDLFHNLKKIEKKLGRKISKRNYPRVCDIDIIDFNGKIYDVRNVIDLQIPHPRLEKRNFVLMPLFEINKKWIHPKTKKNIVNLIANLPDGDIRTIKQK